MGAEGIRIVVIQGSVRPGNYTAMAVRLVLDQLARNADVHAELVDPGMLSLSFPGSEAGADAAESLQRTVSGATGVVLATPEYHGTFSAMTKLVLENLGFPSVLAGKPVALLGVAAGAIGAIKALEHLRSVCSHVGAIVLPGPVSVANVRRQFDESGRCLDPKLEERIRGAGDRLLDYIRGAICPRIALEQMSREGSG